MTSAKNSTRFELAKKVLYSSPSRSLTRTFVRSASNILEKRDSSISARDVIRSVASERLPKRKLYARLTIHNWQAFNRKDFELKYAGETIFGSRIMPPQRGRRLQYRNIIVPSDNPEEFSLSIGATFTIQFREGAWTTPEQIRYDEHYQIQQYGQLHYALRGNTKSPRRLIVTFPDFARSTSSISYPVNYLSMIEDDELEDAAIICFQDRYDVAGNFMTETYTGKSVHNLVTRRLRKLMKRWALSDNEVLFFGAAKGGSIALRFLETFGNSSAVLVAPELDVQAYLTRSRFIHNLYKNPVFWSTEQPLRILQRLAENDRRIDFLFSHDDAFSNQSLTDFGFDSLPLRRYRFACEKSRLKVVGLPLINSLLKEFLGLTTSEKGRIQSLSTAEDDNGDVYVKVRTSAPSEEFLDDTIGFLRLEEGNNALYQQLSPSNTAVGWTLSEDQALRPERDPIQGSIGLEAISPHGDRWTTDLEETPFPRVKKRDLPGINSQINLEINEPFEVSLTQKNIIKSFKVKLPKPVQKTSVLHANYGNSVAETDSNELQIASDNYSSQAFSLARRVFARQHKQTMKFTISHPGMSISDAVDIADEDLIPLTVFIDEQDPMSWTGAERRRVEAAMKKHRLVVNGFANFDAVIAVESPE